MPEGRRLRAAVPDRRRDQPLRILAVVQTPPPYLGQALSAQSFVTGRYQSLQVFHVRMAFSKEMGEVGKPRLVKILHLLALIARILWRRARTGAKVLYYPPAGPGLVPVLRDIVILLCTRWAFRSTVFVFHAAGVSEFEARLPRPLRALFRTAYGAPDIAVQTSALNPPDGDRLGARRVAIVPNGVPDHPLARRPGGDPVTGPPVLLSVGVLRESKGLLVLVEACRGLRRRGLDFRLHLMGAFESTRFESTLRARLEEAGLSGMTTFLGALGGDEKAARFSDSHIFCYPSYFEAESFGRAIVEAMQFSLPVVATRWRGIPSVVAEDESGILVPVRDASRLEAALATLLESPELRGRMGRRGRELYLERFTEDRYRQNIEAVLNEL